MPENMVEGVVSEVTDHEYNLVTQENVQEATPEVSLPVKDLLKDVILKHTETKVNVLNNRGFAKLNGELVEVVRRGEKQTRIRRSLTTNGETELVATGDLTDYTHPNVRKA